MIAIAFWPRSMVWLLSRMGYLLLMLLGMVLAWVVFIG
jgi:hypothetical protein